MRCGVFLYLNFESIASTNKLAYYRTTTFTVLVGVDTR